MAAISDKVSTPIQNGDGTNKAFAFDFSIIAPTDIGAYVDGVAKAYPDDYDVVFGDTSGTVTFHEAPAAGTQILLVSQPDYRQTSEFADQGAYNLSTVNTINRRAAIRDLVTEDKAERALKVPLGEASPEMESLADAEGMVLGIVAGKLRGVANDTAAIASDVARAETAASQTEADRAATLENRAAVADFAEEFADVRSAIAAGTVAALIENRIYTTRVALAADLTPVDGLYALVVGDPTAGNNDLYKKNGATGVGSWSGPLGIFAAASGLAQQAATQAITAAAGLTSSYPELPLVQASRNLTKKFVEGSGSVRPTAYHPFSFISGKSYQIRIIAKAAERQFVTIFSNAGALFYVGFNLLTGSVAYTGTGNTGEIRALGGGWYLCIATCSATATTTASPQLVIGPNVNVPTTPYLGDGSSGIYLPWASLTETGSLTELFSKQFPDDPSWTKNQGAFAEVILENANPPGALIDDSRKMLHGDFPAKLTEASGASITPTLYYNLAHVAGKTYRAWAVVRKGSRSRLNIWTNNATFFNATFDLVAGTATGGGKITRHGDGDYLCEVTAVASTTASPNLQFRIYPAAGSQPYVGDGVSGMYIVAAGQEEDGVSQVAANPSSFVSTAWNKLNLTAALDTSFRMNGLISRVTTLEGQTVGRTASSPLAGKSWAALGSSLTAQGLYTEPLATLSGMILTNLGSSGGALAVATNGHYGSQKIYDAIASIPLNTQVVTIECGANDFASTASAALLGVLGDTTVNTFYGAIYAAATAVYARVPNAKLFFITVPGAGGTASYYTIFATNSNGNRLTQFQQATLEGGGALGVKVIDMGRKAGLGYLNAALNTSDGLHFNAVGGPKAASYIYGDMLRAYDDGYFNV